MRVVVFETYFVKVQFFLCLRVTQQGKIRIIEVSFFLIGEINVVGFAGRRVFYKFRISF